MRCAENPNRRFAVRCSDVRSNSCGGGLLDGARAQRDYTRADRIAPAPCSRSRATRARRARAVARRDDPCCRATAPGTLRRRRCESRRGPPSTRVGTKVRISFSRATSSASVGVCTRPIENSVSPPGLADATVTARVAFMPTSQSASERERAASASASSRAPGLSDAKPRRIASSVSDEIQSRRTGRRLPRVLVDVAEDQLSLATGIAGVDDGGEPAIAKQLRRQRAAAAARDCAGRRRNSRRQHRQPIESPRFPARVVRRRLLELDEMADAPGDRVASPSHQSSRDERTPSTRARSRATDGFSAMTSSTQ